MSTATFRRELTRLRACAASMRPPAAIPAAERLDLVEWAETHLHAEGRDGNPVPLRPESALHHWLCDTLPAIVEERGQRLNVLAPRGSAKSTWATRAYPLWLAAYGLEPYIVVCSETALMASRFLRGIRRTLEQTASIRRDHPGLVENASIWRDDLIKLGNGVVIAASSTGGNIRGSLEDIHRPSLIIIDDPQDKDDIISPILRERHWDWLTRDVLAAGGPRTNFVVLGTSLHAECIVCRLQTTPGWRTRVFRSLSNADGTAWTPARQDLWDAWEAILFDHSDPQAAAKARAFYLQRKADMDL